MTACAQDRPFARDRLGTTIVALNLLAAANSSMYFIGMLGAGVDGWLAMNSCVPSILLFSLGYALGQRPLLAIGAGCMFRYGTLGLYAFGWDGMNIIPQIGHILMTLGVLWFAASALRRKAAGEIIVAGLSALLLLYASWQGEWFGSRPGVLKGLMEGTLGPEMFKGGVN